MLLSMTGFGSDIYSNDKYTLETEIKSLNSRFLDLAVRLPRELSQHEFAVRDLIKSKLIRGKISVSVNLTLNNSSDEEIALDEQKLLQSAKLLNRIKSVTNNDDNISLGQLLLFRENFLDQANVEIDFDLEVILNSISHAIDTLIVMRGDEGAELKKDLVDRIKNIGSTLAKIEELAKNTTNEYFNKFKEKVKKISDEFVDDKDRFLLELGILSEKHDVTEECTRLYSHMKLFNESLAKPQDIGRKLNFICQEMNREVNTINSKSISSEISHLGINIKEELEKIREQVQNIE